MCTTRIAAPASRTAVDAAKAAGITVYAVGIGGVAGISMRGHDASEDARGRDGRPLVFPGETEELRVVRPARVRRADALSRDLHPIESEARWHVAHHLASDRREGLRREGPAGATLRRSRPLLPSIEFTAMDIQNQYLQVSADAFHRRSRTASSSRFDTFQEPPTRSRSFRARRQRQHEEERRQGGGGGTGLRDDGSTEDKLGVVVFAYQSVVAHDLTLNRNDVNETIDVYTTVGGTALYDALCDSFSLLKQAPGRRAVVGLTDGRDENNPGTAPGSTRTYDDVMKALRESEVTVSAWDWNQHRPRAIEGPREGVWGTGRLFLRYFRVDDAVPTSDRESAPPVRL